MIAALRTLWHLFVDDGLLAVSLVLLVSLTACLAAAFPGRSVLIGSALVIGCVALLSASVLRASRKGGVLRTTSPSTKGRK